MRAREALPFPSLGWWWRHVDFEDNAVRPMSLTKHHNSIMQALEIDRSQVEHCVVFVDQRRPIDQNEQRGSFVTSQNGPLQFAGERARPRSSSLSLA